MSKKRKFIWIGAAALALAALIGGASIYLARRNSAEAAATTEAAMQTAVASLGDLTISASGAGQVVPAQQINLGFEEAGTLIELNVALGDEVSAGQVLARLQTQNSAEKIQSEIADAELAVVQAQNSIDELIANAEIARTTALNDIATYAQAVRDAQYTLENYNIPAFMQGMTTIEALDRTKAALDEASAAFEPYRYQAQASTRRTELLEALNLAQSNYDAAVKRLNYEYVLEVAQANLEKARREYEQYTGGPASNELALAQAQLANAEAKLALARETQPVVDLVAPIAGTVTALDAAVGEAVSSGAILTLSDLSRVVLEIYIDETDLDKVAVGNAVEAAFDALPDRTFTGRITVVDPSLQSVSNVQAVKATAELDVDRSQASLPLGLNATVDVIAGKAVNAVLIPIEALRELGDGEYAVFVVENGEAALRLVEIGLRDLTFVEITSGLKAGEIVSTGTQATQ